MIKIQEVKKSYKTINTLPKEQKKEILNEISMEINEGDCVGLIGESGSGKSTLARLILGLEKPDSGEILIEGESVKRWCKKNPGKMSVVFQDYTSSVNPSYTVKQIIEEALVANKVQIDINTKVKELMEVVGLSINLLQHYPHELSGGQLQRVCVARAISTNPKFIVLDEAISSLDVSIQSQILELLANLKKEYNITYLFIAHDLQAVTYLCDYIYFLYRGNIVEHCNRKQLSCVKSDYARELIDSVIPFAIS